MKIGIPRALLYYYYFPFWKTLFEKLGAEVVVSDTTNSQIVSEGASVTVSELCVPIKIFNGHILNLLKKDVDFIFVPQFYSMNSDWYCPKFLAITDLSSYSIPDIADKLLSVRVTSKTDIPNKLSDYLPLCQRLFVSKPELKSALNSAAAEFSRFRALCKSGYPAGDAIRFMLGQSVPPPLEKPDATIALMGYVYNIYDDFVSMETIKNLREMNVRVITFDMLDENDINEVKFSKTPYWVFSRKVYGAMSHLVKNSMVDGVIHITAFACGPDSVIGKLMELDCDEKNVPFMTARVDEHTGSSHIQTRLEAFVDMIKMRKQKEMVG